MLDVRPHFASSEVNCDFAKVSPVELRSFLGLTRRGNQECLKNLNPQRARACE